MIDLGSYVEAWNGTGCRVYLRIVGCGQEKAEAMVEARSLYRGDLTGKRIAIAEDLAASDSAFSGAPYLILSALHGLVDPSALVAPYEATIGSVDRAALVERVREQLEEIGASHGLTLEVEAGAAYRDLLIEAGEGMDVRILKGRTCLMVGHAKAMGRRILDWHQTMTGRTD